MSPRSPELQAAFDQVGEPKDAFKCINTMLALGAAFGVVLMALGAVLPVLLIYIVVTDGFDIRIIQGFLLPFVAYFGWLMFRRCTGKLGARVHLCDGGFVYQHRHGVTVFPWAEITRVGNDDPTAEPGKSGFPRVRTGTGYCVVRADGADFSFSPMTVRRARKLARAIFDATHPLGTKWDR